ncbi:paraquat-inducible protein B [Enterobacter asburiae]|uniref:Paraquat-inducible protein B n=1 Tax=Enterobacter asburiae TaxID=61645 RepID=A0A376F6S8_ENTAS|nr:paraquat-inducible protein B [Enterobacter asburiae]
MWIWTSTRKAPPITGIREFGGYKIIPTVSSGLAQIQQRLMETLDKINNLPLNPMIEAATNSLSESQATMRRLQTTLDNINKITGEPEYAAAAAGYAENAA